MRFGKLLFVFLVFVLFSQSVFALEIVNAEFIWGGESVEYYSLSNTLNVNLHISLNVESVNNLVFDVSDVNDRFEYSHLTNNYNSLSIYDSGGCVEDNDLFNCVFRGLVLFKAKDVSNLSIYVKNQGVVSSFNIPIKRSSASPGVSFIGTDNCYDDKCYVSSGNNDVLIKLNGSDAGFSRGLIGFSIGSARSAVSSCDGVECSGNINIQCVDGQELFSGIANVRGVMRSVDDAGIPIKSSSFNMVCDSSPPSIREIKVIDARDIGITELSDSFRVTAKVFDSTSPVLNMEVLGESIGSGNVSGNCVMRDNLFECDVRVTSAVKERGFYDVPVVFRDGAGNEVREVVEVELVEVRIDEVPNFWRVAEVVQPTDSLTIRNMGYTRDIFVEVDLAGDADLLRASVSNFRCAAVSEDTGNSNDITDIRIIKFDKDDAKVYLKLTLKEAGLTVRDVNRYSDFDFLEYSCGLDLISRKDGYFYSSPEKKNFTVKFNLDQSRTLDEHVFERIEKIQVDLKEQNERLDKWEYALNVIQTVCKSIAGLDAGKQASAIAQIALEASVVGSGAAQGMKGVTHGLDETSTFLSKFGSAPCEMVACKSSIVDNFYGDTLGLSDLKDTLHVDVVSDALGMSSRELFNPYKSEIIAIGTACVPAIIYHRRVKQGIDCNYALCLESGIKDMGLSVEQCEINKAYDNCLRVSGNIFYMLPYTNMFSQAAADVQQMIRDPVAFIGGAIPLACKTFLSSGSATVHGGCVVAQTVLSLPVHYKRITEMIDQFSLVMGGSSGASDSCEPVLSGSLQAIKTNWDFDSKYEGFGYGRESYAEENKKEFTFSNNAVANCLGNTCFIYESNKPDAELIGKTVSTHSKESGSETIMYGPTGQQINYMYSDRVDYVQDIKDERDKRLNAIRDEDISNLEQDIKSIKDGLSADDIEDEISEDLISDLNKQIKELNDLDFDDQADADKLLDGRPNLDISDEEKLLFNILDGGDGLVTLSKDYIEQYFIDYETKFPEAYDFAVSAANIRADRAERLGIESERRDDTQSFRDVRDYVGRNTPFDEINWDDVHDKTGVTKEDFEKTLNDLDIKFEGDDRLRSINRDVEDHIKDGRDPWVERFGQSLKQVFSELMVSEAERYRTLSEFAKMREGAIGLSTAADLFGFDNREWAEDTVLGRFASSLDYVTEPERVFCDSAYNRKNIPEEGGLGSAVSRKGGGTMPGAYISARRSAPQSSPGEDLMYTYWVEGGVEAERDGLKFKIYAYDSSGERYDYTKKVARVEEPVSKAGTLISFGGFQSSTTFSSPVEYSKFCIHFDDRRVSDYFYMVNLPGGELCQLVVGE